MNVQKIKIGVVVCIYICVYIYVCVLFYIYGNNLTSSFSHVEKLQPVHSAAVIWTDGLIFGLLLNHLTVQHIQWYYLSLSLSSV